MTTDLSAQLRALKPKSLAAQVRPLLPEIDAAIKKGCRHGEIVELLNSNGIHIKAKALRNYLDRWRKQRATTAPNSPENTATTQRKPEKKTPIAQQKILDSSDLAVIRNQPVDLQALAKAAPKKPNN